ncbi:MAG: hypothetical protein ACJ79A_18730 [Gemmatimonadaceae bacterium]
MDYALGGGSSGATERDAGAWLFDAGTATESSLSRSMPDEATVTKPVAHAENI